MHDNLSLLMRAMHLKHHCHSTISRFASYMRCHMTVICMLRGITPCAALFVSTSAVAATPSDFRTPEHHTPGGLDIINAAEAYARGYTAFPPNGCANCWTTPGNSTRRSPDTVRMVSRHAPVASALTP